MGIPNEIKYKSDIAFVDFVISNIPKGELYQIRKGVYLIKEGRK